MLHALLTFLAHWLVQLLVVVRVMLRPHREPASRVAWVAVIALLPAAGVVLYLLLGEVSPGRRRLRHLLRTVAEMPPYQAGVPAGTGAQTEMLLPVPEQWRPLFQAGQVLCGFPLEGGNHLTMPADSNGVIDELVADIDGATVYVHLLFYIWLPDRNGTRVAEAVQRAARRGVVCRVMADGMGSRGLVRGALWRQMGEAGAKVAVALPVKHPLLGPVAGSRMDMRNHRKIAVIDGRITYCGSQNCADPEFLVKAKFAPWVDAVLRIEGPAARQNLHLFARDWTSATGEKLDALLTAPVDAAAPGGACVQVVASGPSFPVRAMPDLFVQLLYGARREAVITTPYYVPDETLQHALCACARRGVATTLILPARNDSRMVAAASRSYYADLLAAGVRVYEFTAGLLHAKTFVVDGTVTLFGSANMDRRSFELNQENNMLICDAGVAAMVRTRQEEYLRQSRVVTVEEVAAWPMRRRLWNNAMATMGPLI